MNIETKDLNLNDIPRDIYKDMLKWKSTLDWHKTTLEIEGARQIGKSFIAKKFAEENFKKVYYIDLFDVMHRSVAKQAIDAGLSAEDTIKLFFPEFEDSPVVVIVIDEVQEFAHMYNLIKPIALQMKAHMIVTGSFLGKTINREYFEVGAERTTLKMMSLSFPEFLSVFNARGLYESIDLYGGSPHEGYERLKKLYNLYLILGGHPPVIRKTLKTMDIEDARKELAVVLRVFCKDSERYFDAVDDAEILPKLLKHIAEFLLMDNRANFSFRNELPKLDYGGGTTRKTITRCLSWLSRSHLISTCHRYVDMEPSNSSPDMRYYFADVGIANYMYGLTNSNPSNRIGRLTESFVYRCFLDNNLFEDGVPHYATYGDMELDFFTFIEDAEGKVYKLAFEFRNQRTSGGSADKLLSAGKLDYLVYIKGDAYGGRNGRVLTIPIYLIGRFKISEIVVPSDAGNKALTDVMEMQLFNK